MKKVIQEKEFWNKGALKGLIVGIIIGVILFSLSYSCDTLSEIRSKSSFGCKLIAKFQFPAIFIVDIITSLLTNTILKIDENATTYIGLFFELLVIFAFLGYFVGFNFGRIKNKE